MADNWRDKLKGLKDDLLFKKKKERDEQLAKSREKKKEPIDPKKSFFKPAKKADTYDRKKSLATNRGSIPKQKPSQGHIIKSSKLPLPSKPSSGSNRITVGLDFGTSTTKVCMRKELGGDDVAIYPIPLNSESISTKSKFLCPSLLSIKNGKVFFGDRALQEKEQLIPHLKVCIACEINKSDREGHIDCVYQKKCPFDHLAFPVKASEMATLYLAWVMKKARANIPRELTSKELPLFTYNLGVPVKQLDENPLLESYRKISHDAWRLSEGLHQGIKINQAVDWIAELEDVEIPSIESSPIQLAPETNAAIVAYLKSSDSLPGLYGIIDIGAWTSDISFFRLTDINMMETATEILAFYGAGVYHKAANSIDKRIAQCLMELWGIDSVNKFDINNIEAWIRNCREQDSWNEEVSFKTIFDHIDSRSIPSVSIDFSRESISEAVLRCFTTTWKEAFQKEKVPDRWKNLVVFIIGGGENEECFQNKIMSNFSDKLEIKHISYSNIDLPPNSNDMKRLGVAIGLSYPLGMWPEQFRPSEVEEWIPQKPLELNHEDMYSEP
jgi:hypothetical protein